MSAARLSVTDAVERCVTLLAKVDELANEAAMLEDRRYQAQLEVRNRDDAVVEVKNVCQREKMLYLTVDGRINFEIYRGDSVRVTRSPMTTRLIRLQRGGFYTKLQQKMNFND
jgi:hypothetical protein